MIYIMLGGPATGKGTRSEILSKALNIPHISTGDILRNAAKNDNEIADMLAKGMLISDEVMDKMVFDRISSKDCQNGFILDGYPRTPKQAETLDNMLAKLGMSVTKALELIASKELVFKRILERKECPRCKRSYGIDFPAKDGIHCDDCGTLLTTRADDTKETLEKRINTYNENAKPILDFYREKGLLKSLDSSHCPENILDMIEC